MTAQLLYLVFLCGVAVRITKEQQAIIVQHCQMQSLNLAVGLQDAVSAVGLYRLRKMFTMFTEVNCIPAPLSKEKTTIY